MFELQHGGAVQVFRDVASAEKWLGLAPPAYAPAPQQLDVAARARCG